MMPRDFWVGAHHPFYPPIKQPLGENPTNPDGAAIGYP